MVASILKILAVLIPWVGRHFSPEAKLARIVLAEAKRKSEVKLRAAELRRTYNKIAQDRLSGKDLLDSLNKNTHNKR